VFLVDIELETLSTVPITGQDTHQLCPHLAI
jgi:hypothetical protein